MNASFLPSLLTGKKTILINNNFTYFLFQCSTTCEKGTRTRTKSCQQLKETSVFQSVPDVMCATAIVPPQKEACNQDALCPGSTTNL